jgi:intracellular multiplication protein IcmL
MVLNTQSQDNAIALNTFYRDNYRRTMKWVVVMAVICALLSAILLWDAFDPSQPDYYASVTTGEVVPMHAMSEPMLTSAFIVQWSALTARLIYNLNFATYQQQLNQVKDRFTAEGWQKMTTALASSGMIKSLVHNHLIISSVVSGSPLIVSQLVINGRYTWRVTMRLLVTYTSASETTQRQMVVTMNVQRVPTLDNPKNIQIIAFQTGVTQ